MTAGRSARAMRRLAGRRLRARKPSPSSVPLPMSMLELCREGPVALSRGAIDTEHPLRIAAVIPSFGRGSGGHNTLVRILSTMQQRGHQVSLWLEDCEGRHAYEAGALTKSSFAEFFDADGLELHTDMSEWTGADVALATGWQTVARTLLLPETKARAYLVQDHEPDFHGVSAERLWAEWTYRQGLACIAASPWLAQLLRERYGAQATHFDLAIDHDIYRVRKEPRRDVVLFYARATTPRRAVPLGALALAELAQRRPHVEIAFFGNDRPLHTPFEHIELGVLDGASLAALYSQAAVGLALSLTNPSLINLEMMACGLPCVELASESMLATFGTDGPLELIEPDPLALCSTIERLLDDREHWDRLSDAGIQLMKTRTWERAAAQVEQGLRLSSPAQGLR